MKRSFALGLLGLLGLLVSHSVAWAADEATPPLGTAQPTVSTETPVTPATKPAYSFTTQKEALKMSDDLDTAQAQVASHPDDPEAHFLAAAAYSRSPYLEKAFKHIKKVKEILKTKQDFEFIDRTLTQYEQLRDKSPNDPVILYRMALAYYLKAYSVEKYPHHYKNGPVGSPQDYYEKARATMSRVVELNPQDTWARNYMGYFVSENGQNWEKAIPIWKESLAINEDHNPGAYLMLGQAYLKLGDLGNGLLYHAKGIQVMQVMGMTLP